MKSVCKATAAAAMTGGLLLMGLAAPALAEDAVTGQTSVTTPGTADEQGGEGAAGTGDGTAGAPSDAPTSASPANAAKPAGNRAASITALDVVDCGIGGENGNGNGNGAENGNGGESGEGPGCSTDEETGGPGTDPGTDPSCIPLVDPDCGGVEPGPTDPPAPGPTDPPTPGPTDPPTPGPSNPAEPAPSSPAGPIGGNPGGGSVGGGGGPQAPTGPAAGPGNSGPGVGAAGVVPGVDDTVAPGAVACGDSVLCRAPVNADVAAEQGTVSYSGESLPDTGAPAHAGTLAAGGLGLFLAGALLVRRPVPAGRHRA